MMFFDQFVWHLYSLISSYTPHMLKPNMTTIHEVNFLKPMSTRYKNLFKYFFACYGANTVVSIWSTCHNSLFQIYLIYRRQDKILFFKFLYNKSDTCKVIYIPQHQE